MEIWRVAAYVAGGIAVLGTSFFATLQLIDSVADPPGVVVLQTAANTHDPGWPDHTMRVIIPRTAFAAFGQGVKIQFGAGTAKGLSIAKAYIGNPAPSGAPYAFAGPPIPITFGGKPSFVIPKAGQVLSDEVPNFPLRKDRDLLISFHINSPENDDPIAKRPTPGWRAYYKGKDDAATIAATDYIDRTPSFVSHGVAEVRVIKIEQ